MRFLLAALLMASAAVSATSPPKAFVNDAAIQSGVNPATLADFGFFADAVKQVPVKGVMPYRLNTPLWSDGAEKLRFVYVPEGQRAVSDGEGLLKLPVGSALIKTFKMGANLIETRVLLHREAGWVALPYQWNAAQTEAKLVLAGARVDVVTPAGQAISYAIPNKNQCKECHALSGAVTLIGPKARNLARSWLVERQRGGQLDEVPSVAGWVPLWEEREHYPAVQVARGYLDANCAHCHNPSGSASNSGLDLRWEQKEPLKIGIMKRPVAAGRGSGGFEFDVVPGQPEQSILYHRMGSLEGGVAMPELGRASLDPDGMAVVARWIRELKL